MKTFKVKCSWKMKGYHTVVASSEIEAEEKVYDNKNERYSIDCIRNPKVIDDSFLVEDVEEASYDG